MYNEEDRKWLYDKMKSSGIDTGNYDDFKNSLNNDEDREWYYNKSIELGLDVGSPKDFDDMMLEKKPAPAKPQEQKGTTPASPAEPTQQRRVVNNNGEYGLAADKPVETTQDNFVNNVRNALQENVAGEGAGVGTTLGRNVDSKLTPEAEQAMQEAMQENERDYPAGQVNKDGSINLPGAVVMRQRTGSPSLYENPEATTPNDYTLAGRSYRMSWYNDSQGKTGEEMLPKYGSEATKEMLGDRIEERNAQISKLQSDMQGNINDDTVAKINELKAVNVRDKNELDKINNYSSETSLKTAVKELSPTEKIAYDKFMDIFHKKIDELDKAGEVKRWEVYQANQNMMGNPGASLGVAMLAERLGNKASDPMQAVNAVLDKLWEKHNGEARTQEQMAAQEDWRSKIGMMLVQSMQQELVKKNMPKNAAEYILGGLSETDLGQIVSSITKSDYQRYLDQLANAAYDSNMLERVLRGGVTFAGDMWEFVGAGKLAKIATKGMQKRFVRNMTEELIARGVEKNTAKGIAKRLLAQSTGKQAVIGAAESGTMGAIQGAGSAAIKTQTQNLGDVQQYIAEQEAQGKQFSEEEKQQLMQEASDERKSFGATMEQMAEQGAWTGLTFGLFPGGTPVGKAFGKVVGNGGVAQKIVEQAGRLATNTGTATAVNLAEKAVADEVPADAKGKDQSVLEMYAETFLNFALLELPGFAKRLGKYKDIQAFEKAYHFSDADKKALNDAGYGSVYESVIAAAKKEKPSVAYKGEGYEQLDVEEINEGMKRMMEDPNLAETTKRKVYAMATGDYAKKLSPVVSHSISKDGNKYVLERYNQNGDVVSREEFRTYDAAESEADKYEFQEDLNHTAALENSLQQHEAEHLLKQLYDKATEKDTNKRTEEDKLIITLYRYKDEVGQLLLKKQTGGELTQNEESLIQKFQHVVGTLRERSNVVEAVKKELETEMNLSSGDIEAAMLGHSKKEIKEDDNPIRLGNVYRTGNEHLVVQEYRKRLLERLNRLSPEDYPTYDEPSQPLLEERKNMDAAYSKGYDTTDEEGMQDAKYAMEAARERLISEIDEQTAEDLDNDPFGTLRRLSPTQWTRALDYINAKAAYNGMIQRVRDGIDSQVEESNNTISQRTNKADGQLHPADTKYFGKVFIVDGQVTMLPDGTMVDKEKSDRDIIVIDEQGKTRFIPAEDILSVDEPINAEEESQRLAEEIRQSVAQEAANKIDGTLPFRQGDTYEVTDEQGTQHAVQVVQDLGDGTVTTIIDGQIIPTPVSKEQIQAWADNAARIRREQREAEEQPQGETPVEETPATAETETSPEETPVTTEEVPTTTETETPVEEEPVTTEEDIQPTEENRQEPMPMVEVGGKQKPDWSSASPARAHAYIYNERGLSRENANAFVENNRKAAEDELKKLQKKQPKMGTDLDEFDEKNAAWQQQVDAVQQRMDYWSAVKQEQDKIAAAEQAERAEREQQTLAEARAQEQQRQQEELAKQTEQAERGANAVAPAIREKWQSAPKVEGVPNEIVLANGERVPGRYVLVESGAATPSHNPNAEFARNEGFPVDENEQSVNDRDYERDKNAQGITRQIAGSYDSRALQTPVIVSKDGVVLSGNGRTMAGELAAQNNTDGAYIDYLKKYGQQYGFTPEQVESMQHPRVLFVPDNDMPYTAETFAKFNQQEMKGQSKTEQAVKLGKVVDDSTFNRIIRSINNFDTLGEFYGDTQAATEAINELLKAGAINQMQYGEMFDGDTISEAGKQMLENMLIGKAFESNPDAVRQLTEVKSLRQNVVNALADVSSNLQLGEDYNLESELAQAIELAYRARKSGFKLGDKVSGFARQQNLFQFDEGATVADYTNMTILMLADAINGSFRDDKNKLISFKKILANYNSKAADSAVGQADIFSGGVKTKEDILREVLEILGYGKELKKQAANTTAVERPRSSESAQQDGATPAVNTDGEATVEPSEAQKEAGKEETTVNPELKSSIDNYNAANEKYTEYINLRGEEYDKTEKEREDALEAAVAAKVKLREALNSASQEELEYLKSNDSGEVRDMALKEQSMREAKLQASETFDERIKEQGEITGKGSIKPLSKATVDIAEKNEQRPVMGGVYHDPEGYGVVSDGHTLVVSKELYDKKNKGKIIAVHELKSSGAKKGEEIKGKYPKWRMVIPKEVGKTAEVNWQHLSNFLAGVTAEMKKRWQEAKEEGRKESFATFNDNTRVALRMPDGTIAVFRADSLAKFVNAAQQLDAKEIEYTFEDRAIAARGKKGLALQMPVSSPYDVIHEDNVFFYDSFKEGKGVNNSIRFERASGTGLHLSEEERRLGEALDDVLEDILGDDYSTDWVEGMKVLDADRERRARLMGSRVEGRKADIAEKDKQETEKIFEAAKEKFGTTYDIREAGYILPDGTMLDFSGKHELDAGTDASFLNGQRSTDHREISKIAYDRDAEGNEIETGIKTDMPDFIERGAIRIDSNAGTINLSQVPTDAQKEVLRRLISRNDGYVSVDFGNGWDSDHYVEYDGAKALRVLSDIDKYFNEGIRPQGDFIADAKYQKVAPVFYSNAEHAVEGIKQEKATPEQWLKMIEKAGGMKAGEDKWLGLSDWLKGQDKKSLTKQEVLDYIRENQVQIEEVNYTERREFNDNGEVVSDAPIDSTRLRYTTEGLDNKREIALTVPTIEPYNESDNIHFGDAGGGRAVAWIRFGETTDADGKRVLVIDEIQSKRHQEGREHGYAVSEEKATREMDAFLSKMKDKYHYDPQTPFNEIFNDSELKELQRLNQQQYDASFNRSAIPDAPFEKNWHELAMKRMLRYAAENGYDKVAWTTGEQQAERYNIGNAVRSIDAGIDQEGKRVMLIHQKEGGTIDITHDDEGNILSMNEIGRNALGDARNIRNVVGKEIATDALNVQGKGAENMKTWEGEGLRIGGEGMKGFYDQMLPRFMDKYGKKWGVKVGEVELPNLEKSAQHMWNIDVTPEMKKSVTEGQPMFFRTETGEAYGFTLNGKIYIDPRIATSETRVHEYAHLWAQALRKGNPKEWQNVITLMKGTSIWDGVKERYPELRTDDDVAEEVLAHYSGRRGAERLRAAQEEALRNAKGVIEKAQILSTFDKVKQAIKRFWKAFADFLHIHYTSAEEVADRVMADLLDKVNPKEMLRKQQENPHKAAQLDIVTKENPMQDDYHTGIRSIDDIKTYEEAVREGEGIDVYPDFTQADADKALSSGKITVYSSKPIRNGAFVSASRMEAKDYAGGGKVYSKEVPLEDVAWIYANEGQYAKVEGEPARKAGRDTSKLEVKDMTPAEMDREYMRLADIVEKPERIEKLKNSKPVEATGREYEGKYELNNRSAAKYVNDSFRGTYTNKDTGDEIKISRKGAFKVTRHDAENTAHLQSVALIPQMLKNAIFITEERNTKGTGGFDSYRYYVVGLKMGGVDYTAKLVVGVKDAKTYYDHALTEIEKTALINRRDEISSSFTNDKAVVSGYKDKRLLSILQTNPKEIAEAEARMREIEAAGGSKVRFHFVGEQGASMADHTEEVSHRMDNLAVAREMEESGKDAKAIKMATGWERGGDGKWRYEIEDADKNTLVRAMRAAISKSRKAIYEADGQAETYRRKAWALDDRIPQRLGSKYSEEEKERYRKMRKDRDRLYGEANKAIERRNEIQDAVEKEGHKTTLGEVLKGSELLKAYPSLAEIEVRIKENMRGAVGSYNPEKKTLEVMAKDVSINNVYSTMMHEIQHAIQYIEGFAHGGNLGSILKDREAVASLQEGFRNKIESKRKEQEEIRKKLTERSPELWDEAHKNNVDLPEQIRKYETEVNWLEAEINHLERLSKDLDNGRINADVAEEYYRRLGGEVESRNVQRRIDMTAEERRRTLASETEDVSRKDQKFLFGEEENDNLSLQSEKTNENAFSLGGNSISLHTERDVEAVRGQKERFSPTAPWRDSVEDVVVHTTLGTLRGKHVELYNKAKAGDVEAAEELVSKVVKSEKVKALAEAYPKATVVPVHAEEALGRNKIPAVYAKQFEKYGLAVVSDIRQINKPFHTGSDRVGRFIRRARFDGEVEAGKEYILVDDHITMGSTLRDLKDYIEGKGGKVVAISTLTASAGGTKLRPTEQQKQQLKERGVTNEQLKELGIADSADGLTRREVQEILVLANTRGVRGSSQRFGRNSGTGANSNLTNNAQEQPELTGGAAGEATIVAMSRPNTDGYNESDPLGKKLSDLKKEAGRNSLVGYTDSKSGDYVFLGNDTAVVKNILKPTNYQEGTRNGMPMVRVAKDNFDKLSLAAVRDGLRVAITKDTPNAPTSETRRRQAGRTGKAKPKMVSMTEGNLFGDKDFEEKPQEAGQTETPEQQARQMTDEGLLEEIAKGASQDGWNYHIEEYDRRHNKEYLEGIDNYTEMLEREATDLEDAYGMYAEISKRWKDGGYGNEERTALRSQMDALEDYIQKKEAERMEEEDDLTLLEDPATAEQQAEHEKQKEEVRAVGYDLTQLKMRELEEDEECHVERKYVNNGFFSFTGGEHIESANDVAYLFRQLEDSSVENSFMVLIKDGTPTVIHLGIGNYASTVAPLEQALVAFKELNPDKVVFLHNHPSGNLRPSRQDFQIDDKVQKIFGKAAAPSIIIDTKSGKYAQFIGGGSWTLDRPTQVDKEVPVKVFNFSKQVFDKDWNPETAFKALGSDSVAAYVSSHRLGEHKKMSLLVLDQAGHITGNIFLPWTKIEDAAKRDNLGVIATYVNQMGGTSMILYGSYEGGSLSESSAMLQSIKNNLKADYSIHLMDAMSTSGMSAYEHGLIAEPEEEYSGQAKNVSNEDGNDVAEDNALYRIREDEPPTKTGIGYKVFVLKDGKLYPPMVANPNGEATPVGVWLDADAAPVAGVTKTGRQQVKAGGKGTQGGSGKLAYRPGWHLGEIPYALQFNRINPETGQRELFPANFVWAEVEYADDVDYNEEARSYGMNANGKYQHSLAGLPRVPENGSYKYRTNPDPNTDPWIITGAMRVKRVLTPSEVDQIVEDAGREPQERQAGAVTDEQVNALNAEIEHTMQEDADMKRTTAEQIGEKLNVKLNIIEDVDDITHPNAEVQERRRRSKGWYDTATGEVYIVLPNNADVDDVKAIIGHETVAHKGLRELIGEERYNDFLDETYSHLRDDLKQQVDDEAGKMFLSAINTQQAGRTYEECRRTAVDELFGRLVEKPFEEFSEGERTLWQKIKDTVRRLLDKFLGSLKLPKWFELGDNELRYILWRSKERLERGREHPIDLARDIVKREELGLTEGNTDLYREDGEAEEYDAGRKSLSESLTEGLIALANKNRDNLTLRINAMRAIGGNLSKLRQAMARQREYDKETVNNIVRWARVLMNAGYGGEMTKGEVSRLIGMIGQAAAREDITKQANAIMDLMITHNLRACKEILSKQLRVKGSKLNSSGVEVQAGLDIEGQRMVGAFKDAMALTEDALAARIEDTLDRMGSNDSVIANNATADYQGLLLAQQYLENVKKSEVEEKTLKQELKTAKEDYKAGNLSRQEYKEYVASIENALRENKLDRIEAYGQLVSAMGDGMRESVERAKEWRESEKQRVNEIHHNANSDLNGVSTSENEKLSWWQKANNWSLVRFFAKPLATFDYMLRFFGSKSVDGRGYLFNRFMGGWTKAADREWRNLKAAHNELDAKVSEVMGKEMRWSDLFDIERKMPTVPVEIWDAGEKRNVELTQGNLLYIYMVNKMSDGKMKLRRMGITEEDVDYITEKIDPRFKEIADWVQEEFLTKKREEYNKVYERMFGSSMAAIDNYFPLKINSRSRGQEEDIGSASYAEDKPATITGSVIKRTRNSLPLDLLGADAFDVVLEHLQDMEHWAAFAEFSRDLNTLLSYRRFKNRVLNMSSTRYGAGEILWKNFKDVCAIAAGTYQPIANRNSLDKAAVNVAKGVTAAKISLRIYTALKQLLSYPAYFSEASVLEMAKSTNPIGAVKAWNWAIEELPGFAERWESRQAGDSRLKETDNDWSVWKNKIVEISSRWGMSPNAFVDGLTVAMGAKAIYETKYKTYKKMGYPAEKAKEKALQDASMAYNETQQSSGNAYLSAMQVDRTLGSVALTVFRNASMGYERRMVQALSNLKNKMRPGYRQQTIDFMTKEMMRDGLTEEQAKENAEWMYKRSWFKDVADTIIFGFVLQAAWNLGPYLPYLLAGDDDDEKDSMLSDALWHALAGGIEGLSGGNLISELYNNARNGTGWRNFSLNLLPLMSDIQNTVRKFDNNAVAGWNEVFNIIIQSGVGVNPQTITDAMVAIMDYTNGNPEEGREIAMLMMRLLQIPQSSLDKLYIDELQMSARDAKKLDVQTLAKRYIDYKRKKEAPLTDWAYSDEMQQKVDDKYSKRFENLLKERIEQFDDEKLEQYYDTTDPVLKKSIGKEVAKRLGGTDSYGSPSTDYGDTYLRMRDYIDLAEDILLQSEGAKAKQVGDTEREKDINAARNAITVIKKELTEATSEEERQQIMQDIREERKAWLNDLNITHVNK